MFMIEIHITNPILLKNDKPVIALLCLLFIICEMFVNNIFCHNHYDKFSTDSTI